MVTPGLAPGSVHPDPGLIKAIRGCVRQTQTQAAETVHARLRTWQDWEAGARRMPRAAWELYLLHHVACGRLRDDRTVRKWVRAELLETPNAELTGAPR